jgi:hypothetical protein
MEAPERLIAQYSSGSIGLDQLVMGLERVRRAFPALSNACFLGELGTTLRQIGVKKAHQALILSKVRTRLRDADMKEAVRGLGALLFSLGSYFLVASESWPGGALSTDGWASVMVLVGALGWAIGLGVHAQDSWIKRFWPPSALADPLGSGLVLSLGVLLIVATG